MMTVAISSFLPGFPSTVDFSPSISSPSTAGFCLSLGSPSAVGSHLSTLVSAISFCQATSRYCIVGEGLDSFTFLRTEFELGLAERTVPNKNSESVGDSLEIYCKIITDVGFQLADDTVEESNNEIVASST